MSDTKHPLVSVLVPIYNVERYLERCLSSLAAQTFNDFEVICVNDGSTDGSLDIMREHAAHDPRVRVIDKPNAGYGAACNTGIDAATGDYVAIVEPDDYLTGDMFGDLLAFATGVLLLAGEFIGLLVGGGLLRFLVFHVIPRLSGKRISC